MQCLSLTLQQQEGKIRDNDCTKGISPLSVFCTSLLPTVFQMCFTFVCRFFFTFACCLYITFANGISLLPAVFQKVFYFCLSTLSETQAQQNHTQLAECIQSDADTILPKTLYHFIALIFREAIVQKITEFYEIIS